MKCKALQSLLLRVSLLWLLILLVGGYVWWQLHQTQSEMERHSLQEASLRATQLADVLAANNSSVLSAIDMGLQQLRNALLNNPTELASIAQSVLDRTPPDLVAYLSIVDAAGYTLFSTLNNAPPTFVGEHDHFKNKQSSDDKLLVSSPSQTSMVKDWTFIVNRPVLQNGRFVGTVNASLRTDNMAYYLRRATLSGMDVVSLLTQDGIFLARSRENRAAMGKSVLTDRPFLVSDATTSGTFTEAGSLDQVARIFAWRQLPEFGLVLVVGLDKEAILRPLKLKRREDLYTLAMLGTLLILIAMLLSALYWRDEKQQRKQQHIQQTLKAINQAQSRFIKGDSAYAVFDELLSVLLLQTESEYGFIGEVMHDSEGKLYIKAHGLSNIAWNDETRFIYAENINEGLDFYDMDSLFGRVVTERKLVIANDVAADPRRRGLPAGHPPLRRFMGIPLYQNEGVSGVIALANRAKPYNASLLDHLKPLMTASDNLFGSMQRERKRLTAEAQVVELNKSLEQRVYKRTEELERANEAKSEFLSRMSHELRTPLNAILGFTQLLQLPADASLNSAQADNVQEIQAAGKHLLNLVNEILDLATIESGQLKFFTEPVMLQPLIKQCIKQISPAAEQHAITISLQTDCICYVTADATRLNQILLNLLSNAVKYNREGGSLELSCTIQPLQTVRVSVRDTGLGLNENQISRLFKPFERLDSAYSGIAGSGIGLALAKQLVEGMQGRIGVSSEPGKGSHFWFELPLCEPAVGITPPQEPLARVMGEQHTILYIEDNLANLRLVQKILVKHSDMRLLTAENGEQGLQLAKQKRPQLILLDINMPGMDGFDVLQQLHADANLKETPVIAISANAMQRDIERGIEAGFVDYITKPIQVPAFLQSIRQSLQKQQFINSKDLI